MTEEALIALGRLVAVVVVTTLAGFLVGIARYRMRRRDFLLSRMVALELAGELDDKTVDRFDRIAPHFRQDVVADPQHMDLKAVAELKKAMGGVVIAKPASASDLFMTGSAS